MSVSFLLKKLITALVMPPFSLLLLAIIGLLIIKRWPRIGRAITSFAVIVIVVLATPAVSRTLLRSLDVSRPPTLAEAKSAQAIVILGGGLRRNTPEFGDSPTSYTLDRIRYGAFLAKETNLPVLVSGGAGPGSTPEAGPMATTLEKEFSVPVRWREDRSLDTEDNLNFSAEILKREHIKKVLLVTHDFHMLRALAHCEAAGLICVPAPVSWTGRTPDPAWVYRLPNGQSLATSELAIHEMVGYLALRLK